MKERRREGEREGEGGGGGGERENGVVISYQERVILLVIRISCLFNCAMSFIICHSDPK